MIECPICHKPGISAWRKSCLGPAVPTRCKQCGKKVGVPYSGAMIAILPFIVSILISSFVDSLFLKGLTILIGIIIMSVAYMKYVPLINMEQKQSENKRKGTLESNSENRLKKAFKSTFPSVFPAFGIYMFSNMMFGSPIEGKIIVWPFLVSWGLFAYWFYHADSNRRMWFRTLVSLAIMSFLFPVAVFIGGIKMSFQQTDGLAGAASLIGAGIATVFVAVFGILFGLAFSVGAYFLGKSIYSQQDITKPKIKAKRTD